MKDEDIERLINLAVDKAVATILENISLQCSQCSDIHHIEQHEEDHRFLRSLRDTAIEWKRTRWRVLGHILEGVCWVLLVGTIIGLLIMAINITKEIK